MRFLLTYGLAMALALLGALIFSSVMQATYPDGILVYPPAEGEEPEPSNSLHIGMATGWFFALLCYSVMALSAWLLVRFNTIALATYPLPFLSAALSCLGLLCLSLLLAG